MALRGLLLVVVVAMLAPTVPLAEASAPPSPPPPSAGAAACADGQPLVGGLAMVGAGVTHATTRFRVDGPSPVVKVDGVGIPLIVSVYVADPAGDCRALCIQFGAGWFTEYTCNAPGATTAFVDVHTSGPAAYVVRHG